MKRIFKGQIPRPTRVYETDTGYVVKTRLSFKAMTLFQKIVFGILCVFLGGVVFLGGAIQIETIGGAAFILAVVGAIFQAWPLWVTFTFDKGAQRVKINPGIFKRSTQPIDTDSVFTFDNNDQLEYRRGLNGSVFGYGIKFSVNPKKPWDNAHVTALVAALNEVLKLTRTAPAKPAPTSAPEEHINPME